MAGVFLLFFKVELGIAVVMYKSQEKESVKAVSCWRMRAVLDSVVLYGELWRYKSAISLAGLIRILFKVYKRVGSFACHMVRR